MVKDGIELIKSESGVAKDKDGNTIIVNVPFLVGVKDGKPVFEDVPHVLIPCIGIADCTK